MVLTYQWQTPNNKYDKLVNNVVYQMVLHAKEKIEQGKLDWQSLVGAKVKLQC